MRATRVLPSREDRGRIKVVRAGFRAAPRAADSVLPGMGETRALARGGQGVGEVAAPDLLEGDHIRTQVGQVLPDRFDPSPGVAGEEPGQPPDVERRDA